MLYITLGAVHKRRLQSREMEVVHSARSLCELFAEKGGGGIQMQTFALFGIKIFGFFEIYGVSARTRGG